MHSSAGRGAFCAVLSSGEAAAQHRTFLFLPRPMKSDLQIQSVPGEESIIISILHLL
jgi:hypothetical protein